MGDSSTPASVYIGICVYLLPSTIMQAVGVLSDQWLLGSDCENVTVTTHNDSHIECVYKLKDISSSAYTLVIISGVSLVITLFATCASTCPDDEDEGRPDETNWILVIAVLGNIFYPIAGILSIVGCAIFSTALTTARVGRNFYLCLFAGIIVILFTIIFFGLVCWQINKKKKKSKSGFIGYIRVTEVFVWSDSDSE